MIRIDPATQRTFQQLIEDVAPAVADALNRHLVPVAQRAFDRWPVASGVSRSLLYLTFTPSSDGSALVASLGDRAPYAHLIFKGKTKSQRKRGRTKFDDLHPKAQANILAKKERTERRAAATEARQARNALAGVRRPKKRKRGRRSPKAGEITNALIFEPGTQAAEQIAVDVATAVSRGGR